MQKSSAYPAVKKPRKSKLPEVGDAQPEDLEIGGTRMGDADATFSDLEDDDDLLGDSVETLPELEREIGISDWLDPETGEPAEGQSPPHLDYE